VSTFGIFHTAVSVLAIPFGFYAFYRDGKIDPNSRVGKLYLLSMLVGSLTAFGFIPTKGFDPPQVLTIVTLLTLLGATYAGRSKWLGRAGAYVQTFSASTSFLLLMVFTTTETLTRLPVGHPYAANADAPELIPVRLALLVTFLLGVGYQFYQVHAARKLAVQPATSPAAVGNR
jgi:hypothetical protein